MKQKAKKEKHKMFRLLLGLLGLLWLVLTTDNGGGGNGGEGGGGGAGSQNQNQNPPQPQGGGQDWQQSLSNLIRREGGADATAQLLFQENREHRQRIRQLEQQLPGEGAVVLTGDQAAAWQAYQGLGAPTDVQQRLTAAEQAQNELAGLRRAEQIRGVAEAAGYRPTVLERLAEGLEFEVREEQRDGQTARVPYVVARGEQGEQRTPLVEYAQAHWVDFMPALRAEQAAGQQQLPTQGGVTYPPQQGGGRPAPGDPVRAFIQQSNERREQAANPLRRAERSQ
jgi:hypothetical protein